jgi:hypothetical protein
MASSRTLPADLVAHLQRIVEETSWAQSATLETTFVEFKSLAQSILDAPRTLEADARNIALQAELADAHNDVQALSLAMEEKTRLINLLSRLNPNEAGIHSTSSVKIPDPPIFTDSREEWEGWHLQVQLKLRADAQRFPNATARIAYVISRTAGRAQELLKGHVTDNGFVDLEDAIDVLNILQNAYGDPDPEGTARAKLDKLRQGKHDFAWYISQFDALTNKLRWNNHAKKDALLTGISYEIKERLFFQTPPPDETYQQLCTRCQTIDSGLRALRTERPNKAVTQPAPAPTQPRSTTNQNTSNSQYLGPGPMDLSAHRRRTLDPAEKAKRIAEGRCLYCGGLGHMAWECPNKPAMRAAATRTPAETAPVPANPATPATPVPTVPAPAAGNV